MFSMIMVRAMEKLPYFNYSFTGNVSCYNPALFVDDDDVCPRCGKEGCTCDPDTCDQNKMNWCRILRSDRRHA
mgnify:CR=1 FL=1